jgi:hypothetical protein
MKIDLRFVKFKEQAINTEIRNFEIRVNVLNFLILEICVDKGV